MKKLILSMAVAVLALGTPNRAEAVFIFDTGTPTGTTNYLLFNATGTTGFFAFLGGQFTTANDYTLNSLEGYFATYSFTEAGPIDAVLYFDNAGSVDMVGEIFRQTFSVPQTTDPDEVWAGVYGLNYDLTAGTYWLAFEPQDDAFSTTMRDGAPNPADDYAFFSTNNPGYLNDDALGLGLRIDANDPGKTVVPEPMSVILFGTGLAGAVFRRKWAA